MSEASKPPADDGQGVLRAQTQEIIDQVLAGSSPTAAGMRAQLREHVAAHPGRPETALRDHLAALRPELAAKIDQRVSNGQVSSNTQLSELSSQAAEQGHASRQGVGRARLEAVLRDRMLVTAFQPIYDLLTGSVVGAEALTRFVSDGADPAVYWFAEAEDIGLRTDLEFAALESALTSARELPPELFVALKLSHTACLDNRLPALIGQTSLAPDRMVLELSGRIGADQAGPLEAVLEPLRGAGVRLSIDHSGSSLVSARHVSRLRPEMIKLDAGLTAGIDQDSLRQDLVVAELDFARRIGATLSAQHIETGAELATMAGLGITHGQGFHLGRPTVQPQEWASWQENAGSLAATMAGLSGPETAGFSFVPLQGSPGVARA
ncbi:EAL domain-containing protein [Arthrobacter livingstonensis]|uniref:EAL domain-containing protein n=1 Tax=Arthrobacter livingstonensis TaxID=670078 RepID=UPI001472FC7B|nr:EAL domain-containing protein [Arthrobacter livingstonensis]